MEPFRALIQQMTDLLEDKRGTGLSADHPLSLAEGIFASLTRSQDLQERKDSPVNDQLEQLLDETLAYSPVTDACKARLREEVMVFYRYGGQTNTVLGVLTDESDGGYGPFIQPDFASYEKSMLIAHAGSCADHLRMKQHFAGVRTWAKEWLQKYGPDPEVEGLTQ